MLLATTTWWRVQARQQHVVTLTRCYPHTFYMMMVFVTGPFCHSNLPILGMWVYTLATTLLVTADGSVHTDVTVVIHPGVDVLIVHAVLQRSPDARYCAVLYVASALHRTPQIYLQHMARCIAVLQTVCNATRFTVDLYKHLSVVC